MAFKWYVVDGNWGFETQVKRSLEERVSALTKERQQVEEQLGRAPRMPSEEELEEACQYMGPYLDSLDYERRREAFEMVGLRVTVYPDREPLVELTLPIEVLPSVFQSSRQPEHNVSFWLSS
jgi:hypothetical protein